MTGLPYWRMGCDQKSALKVFDDFLNFAYSCGLQIPTTENGNE